MSYNFRGQNQAIQPSFVVFAASCMSDGIFRLYKGYFNSS